MGVGAGAERRSGALDLRGPGHALLCWLDVDGPSLPLAGLTRRWEDEALRRGARWFGIACACLPLLDLLDGHSVIDAVLAGLATGSWPGVPSAAEALKVRVITGHPVSSVTVTAWALPPAKTQNASNARVGLLGYMGGE